MTDPLIVILGDVIAGSISQLPRGRLRFDYDDAYRSRPDATPLSVSMPVQVPSHPDRVITPWLWGLATGQRGSASSVGPAVPGLGIIAVVTAKHADRQRLRGRCALRARG